MHRHAVQYAVMPVETLSLEQVRPAMPPPQQLQRFMMLVHGACCTVLVAQCLCCMYANAAQVTTHNDLA